MSKRVVAEKSANAVDIKPRRHVQRALGGKSFGWQLPDRWTCGVACLFIGLASAIYSNTFATPFLLDDIASIAENSSIRSLWNLPGVLWAEPRGGTTVDGRPILNFSLAVNYAISGLHVWSYHAFNIALHLLNAGLLLVLLRRIFELPSMSHAVRDSAEWLALGSALLWLVHPLQTAAVTYIVQRGEALMAIFYLATLYCFVRMCSAERPRPWGIATLIVCAVGQGTKEVLATAPLAVLALDAALVSGSVATAIRQRRVFYAGLASSWFVAGMLILRTSGRSGSVGVGTGEGVSPLDYFVAQCGFLLTYLKLCVWPWPQVFDYGVDVPPWDGSQWPQVAMIVGLMAVIFALCWLRPKLGLLGFLPMLILAPTSSFIPVVTQTATEHRMYLPLAAVTTLTVLLLYSVAGREVYLRRRLTLAVVLLLAAGLAGATYARNMTFASAKTLWEDTYRKRPQNVRACNSLANILADEGQAAAAAALYDRALQASAKPADVYCDRGVTWMMSGRPEQAIQDFQTARRIDPKNALACNNLAATYNEVNELTRGLEAASEAIRLDPSAGKYFINRGIILLRLGRPAEALADYLRGTELTPISADGHYCLGSLYYSKGELRGAIQSYERALECKADYADAEYWLATSLMESRELPRAQQLAQKLVRSRNTPADWELLALVEAASGQLAAAVQTLQQGRVKHPQAALLALQLGNLYARQGQFERALPEFRAAAALDPRSAETQVSLAMAHLGLRQTPAAEAALQQALALDAQHGEAQRLLAELKKQEQ